MRTPVAFVIALATCFPSFGAEQSSVRSEDEADDRVEEVVVTGEPVARGKPPEFEFLIRVFSVPPKWFVHGGSLIRKPATCMPP